MWRLFCELVEEDEARRQMCRQDYEQRTAACSKPWCIYLRRCSQCGLSYGGGSVPIRSQLQRCTGWLITLIIWLSIQGSMDSAEG